jgi:hypothetical protein
MALLVPNTGENLVVGMIVNKTAPENLTLKLFKSNTTPAEGDTAATYTEADFTGYSAITLTGASWTVTADTAAYAQQSFTSSANQTLQNVYGYFLVQATSGTLIWAERFTDAPYAISNNGDIIRVTPTITAA